MLQNRRHSFHGRVALLALCHGLSSGLALAATPKERKSPLDFKAFFKPELYISTTNARLAPRNEPCGPTGVPTLSGSAENNTVALSWTAVAGAAGYWVYRSEGHAGCNFGKTKIADVAMLSFTDIDVTKNRTYSYNVVAHGVSQSCFGPASDCLQLTPQAPGVGSAGR